MSNDDIFIVRDLQHFDSITDSIKSQNLHYQNVILEQGIMEANYHISRQLELGLGTKLFYMKRLRIVEGHPRSIETNYINYQLVEGLETMDFSNVSFYDVVLQKKGYRTIRSEEEILVVEAKDDECQLLQMPKGSEILLIKGVTYKAENDLPFEYFELVCDPSFYRFRSVMKI